MDERENWLKRKVRTRLAAQNRTQADLARDLGVKPSHLHQILAAPEKLRMDRMDKLAEALGVERAWLTTETLDDALVGLGDEAPTEEEES